MQDEVDIDTILPTSTATQPVMFRFQSKLWLKVDKSAIEITNSSCFSDSVELLLACFWAFNVEYPYHLKPTYEFIEFLLKITKTPRSACVRELLRYV